MYDLVPQNLLLVLGQRVDGLEAVFPVLDTGNKSSSAKSLAFLLESSSVDEPISVGEDISLGHADQGVPKFCLEFRSLQGSIVESRPIVLLGAWAV